MRREAWLLVGLGAALTAAVAFVLGRAERPTIEGLSRLGAVDPRLRAALDEWQRTGLFPLRLGDDGGLRTDEALQLAHFNSGASKARTLAETPHGRGGAADLYPKINGKVRGLKDDPNPTEAAGYFRLMGEWFKARGFVWGGDFASFKDLPHVELSDWRRIPMPGAKGLNA